MGYQESRTYIILSVLAVLLIISPGCSYIMDSIEGRLTDRASFSIDASYNSGAQEVTITWDERGSGDDFAGYEIYITEEPNDEYVGYELAASYYEDPNTNITWLSGNLSNNSTDTCVLNVSGLATNAPGIYFFRVGLISWDEGDEEDRIDHYIGGTNWNIEPQREQNYYIHTNISTISGYAMVNIY
jgi:hypothetical protein